MQFLLQSFLDRTQEENILLAVWKHRQKEAEALWIVRFVKKR